MTRPAIEQKMWLTFFVFTFSQSGFILDKFLKE